MTKKYKAVIFDAFGTLLQITAGRHPYRQLQGALIGAGVRRTPAGRYSMMTRNEGLYGFVASTGGTVPSERMTEIERDLLDELGSMRLYDDARSTIAAVKAIGLKVGVCSNLAAPYGIPVKLLLPDMDVYALSYEVGHLKPSPEIYRHCTDQLGVSPASCLFVGDTREADFEGPRAFGMSATLIDRKGKFNSADCLRSLREVLTLIDP